MKMTKIERLQLINQFKILNLLKPDAGYEEKINILEGGFIDHYDDLTTCIQEEISNEVSQFVVHVLNMYRDLHFTIAKINDKDIIDLVKFDGFDGTTEFDYWSYTDFILFKLNRFTELTKDNQHKDVDSHWPAINQYERQLEVYRNFKNQNITLNKEQIVEVIKA
ncbi:MAG: YfbU family protein [Acinetobacter sp.]